MKAVWRRAATGWYDRTTRDTAITAVPTVAARRAAATGTTACGSGPAPLAVTRAASTATTAATSAASTRIWRPAEAMPASCGRKR